MLRIKAEFRAHLKRAPVSWAPVCVLALCALAGCRSGPGDPSSIPVALRISAPSSTVHSGGTLQLTAEARLAGGEMQDVTALAQWTLVPGEKGEISATGLFRAWNDVTGLETATAFYKGLSAEFPIDITPRAVTLSLWPVYVTVAAGQRQSFQATVQLHTIQTVVVNQAAHWQLRPGLAGEVDSAGVFFAFPGVAGAETLRVQYQSLMVESYIQVRPEYEPPVPVVRIPASSFVMGDNNGLPNERPAHTVTLSAFDIGMYEVTNAEYVRYLNAAFDVGEIIYASGVIAGQRGPFAGFPYAKILGSLQFPEQFIIFVDRGGGEGEFQVVFGFEHSPVMRLSWYGAMAFCGFYGLRLPTEAEWEMVCRGGKQYEYGTQDGTLSHDLANFEGFGGRDRFVEAAPVGSFPPNPFGVYDLSGNVAEYVFDAYQPNYYAASPPENPIGPGPALVLGPIPGGLAIWRGGAWIHPANLLRAAFRGTVPDQPDNSLLDQSVIGFRVARSIPSDHRSIENGFWLNRER